MPTKVEKERFRNEQVRELLALLLIAEQILPPESFQGLNSQTILEVVEHINAHHGAAASILAISSFSRDPIVMARLRQAGGVPRQFLEETQYSRPRAKKASIVLFRLSPRGKQEAKLVLNDLPEMCRDALWDGIVVAIGSLPARSRVLKHPLPKKT